MTRATPAKRQRARELRQQMTPAERALWAQLRDHRMRDLHIRRQWPILGYIVDFYCHDARLIIEVDGPIHDMQVDYDADRDAAFTADGLRTLHVTNDDVLLRMEPTLARIRAACEAGSPTPSPSPAAAGEGSFVAPAAPRGTQE